MNYTLQQDGTIYNQYGKVLKSHIWNNGYMSVTFSKDTDKRTFSVHRLVAMCFIPNPENKAEVNHKNGIKADNRVQNLEWMTPKENSMHSVASGLTPKRSGSLNGRAKITEEDVRDIHLFYRNNITMKDISRVYPVSYSTIRQIISGTSWKESYE